MGPGGAVRGFTRKHFYLQASSAALKPCFWQRIFTCMIIHGAAFTATNIIIIMTWFGSFLPEEQGIIDM